MGAMRAVKDARLKTPEDVTIIGFDDRQEAAAQEPPLTSVHVPLQKSGYQAVEVLLQHIHGQKDAAPSLKISTSLEVRQSCGLRQDTAGIASVTSAKPVQNVDTSAHQESIVQSMSEAVLAETHRFNIEELRILCGRLMNIFISSIEKGDPSDFQQMMEELLKQVELAQDNAHIWQAVISSLRREVPALVAAAHRPAAQEFSLDITGQG